MTIANNNHRSAIPHLDRRGSATELIVDGEPFVLLAAEVHNSSASNLAYMEGVWAKLLAANCNSAIVPVSWELIEPQEGVFDFLLVDGLILGARRRGLRLVLLWFGTYKNADSTYAPAWVKSDRKRFVRTQFDIAKAPGQFISRVQISPWSDEACTCDARAFTQLMRRVREIDAGHHTVVMVQVENETGLLGGDRDYSPLAEAAFAAPVPRALLDALNNRREQLEPELSAAMTKAGSRTSGTWTEMFGSMAAEVFMAWRLGNFVERVAAAGKAEYPLPMFVNCWLVQFEGEAPGAHPSGGPVSRLFDIWSAAAPSVDIFAPDIYIDDFRNVCDRYVRADNPLLIPEANKDETAAANCWYAFGQHSAICFAPFGLDSVTDTSALAKSYRLLRDLMPMLLKHRGSGRTRGITQATGTTSEQIDLGDYHVLVKYYAPREKGRVPAGGLIIALGAHEFLIAGMNFSVDFISKRTNALTFEFLSIDEGDVRAGQWIPGRRLNGDELWPKMDTEPSLRWVKLDGV